MGEQAEYELERQMGLIDFDPLTDLPRWRSRKRGSPPKPRSGRNPIVTTCPVCGKGCRSVGDDKNAGLKAHMKAKHPKGDE